MSRDQYCMIVEFPNEENKVAIGFQDWIYSLHQETDNKVDPKSLINKEVKMKWPVKEEIEPPSKFYSKKRNIEYRDVIGKILDIGGWTDMSANIKNLTLYGVLNPTRSQRKIVCRKESSSDEDTENNKERIIKSTPKKVKTKKQEQNKRIDKQILAESKKRKLKLKDFKQLYESSESSTGEHMSATTSSIRSQNDILRVENRRLRAELSVYKSIDSLYECRKKIDDMKQALESLENPPNSRQKKELKHYKTMQTQSEWQPEEVAGHSKNCDSGTGFNCEEELKETMQTQSEWQPEEVAGHSKNCDSGTGFNCEEELKEELVELRHTGVYIPKWKLERCNHGKSTLLAADLMTVLFSSREMATSTMTGALGLNPGEVIKNKLDPVRAGAILGYCTEKFPGELALIKKAISKKLNNESNKTNKSNKFSNK